MGGDEEDGWEPKANIRLGGQFVQQVDKIKNLTNNNEREWEIAIQRLNLELQWRKASFGQKSKKGHVIN